jgi:predicted  nucleic acid-binding Zn-ribbon protein
VTTCCCQIVSLLSHSAACPQTRAELDAAEASVAALSADKASLQQELSSTRDKVMLLESELKLKTSRMEAAQQQLASEVQEHSAKQALLQKQLEQLKVSGLCKRCPINALANTQQLGTETWVVKRAGWSAAAGKHWPDTA